MFQEASALREGCEWVISDEVLENSFSLVGPQAKSPRSPQVLRSLDDHVSKPLLKMSFSGQPPDGPGRKDCPPSVTSSQPPGLGPACLPLFPALVSVRRSSP